MAGKRLGLMLAVSFAAGASAAQPSIKGLEACTKVTSDGERLACFDREMAGTSAPAKAGGANAVSGAGGDTRPIDPANKLSPEEKLGLSRAKIERLEAGSDPKPRSPTIDRLQAHVASATVNASSRQIFTLDNGQVWQQVEADTAFAVHKGDAVDITKGVFGSFFLSAGKHSSTRVTRIR